MGVYTMISEWGGVSRGSLKVVDDSQDRDRESVEGKRAGIPFPILTRRREVG